MPSPDDLKLKGGQPVAVRYFASEKSPSTIQLPRSTQKI